MRILLRNMTGTDLALVKAWRSHPDIFKNYFMQQAPLTWEEHLAWWHSRNENERDFIIVAIEETHSRDIGVVNITQLDNDIPEISFTVGEISLWGKGIGKKAVELLCQWLKDKNYKRVQAKAVSNNFRSINLLKSLGFQPIEDRWEKKLNEV